MILNKRGEITFIAVSIIVLIVSFFTLLGFFGTIGNDVANASQDSVCRAWITANSNTGIKTSKDIAKVGDASEFLSALNKKCYADSITIKSKKSEDIYESIGDEMSRCWYRYGEGKSDFLSNFDSTGNWCFLCGVVEFDDKLKDEKPQEFSDFVNWLSKTDSGKIDEEGKKLMYSEYVNFKYYEVGNNELEDIEIEINDLFNGELKDDNAYRDIKNILLGQYETLQDLKLKEINPSEDLYVVYRFNRVSKNLDESMSDAMWTAGGSMGVAIVVGTFAESLIWGGASALVCTVGNAATLGFAAPLCLLMAGKTVKSIVGAGEKIGKTSVKIAKLMKKMKNLATFTKSQKIAKVVDSFTGNINELPAIAKKLEKIDLDYSKKIIKISDDLNKMNVEHVDDLSEMLTGTAKSQQQLGELAKNAISNDLLSPKIITKIKEIDVKNGNKADEILRLQKELQDYVGSGKKLEDNKGMLEKATTYLKGALLLSAGASGATLGFEYNDNSNQYVDILTKEQYYRLCGTESKSVN